MGNVELTVDGHPIRALSAATWPAFAELAGHNGVFGGCWCTWFHCHPDPPERAELGNREFKHSLVGRDRAHAALVSEGDEAIAWAEYGPVEELPNIHHASSGNRRQRRFPTTGSPASSLIAVSDTGAWRGSPSRVRWR